MRQCDPQNWKFWQSTFSPWLGPGTIKPRIPKNNTYLTKIIRCFGLKWVHMARYELISTQDGAIWLTIIFKPLLTPQNAIKIQT